MDEVKNKIEEFKQETDKLRIAELREYKKELWDMYNEVKTILQFKEELKEVGKNA